LERNSRRTGEERVPDLAIRATAKKLQTPSVGEGFDQLYDVRLVDGRFVVEEWRDEV
jgi:hypothetical protein